MSIAIRGLDKLKADIEKIKKLPQAFGNEFLSRVREKTPVDTGRLQAAWALEVNESQKSIDVTNKAVNNEGIPYAVFVEFGTEHTRGYFMLNRTISESSDILRTAKSKVGL